MSMAPKTRLFWSAVLIVGSIAYGILVAANPRVASAIMAAQTLSTSTVPR